MPANDARRKRLGKRVRFEVFKRDNFTCQYCGAEAPAAVLQVDHILPVAEGGTNDLTNLVTACVGCNAGKSDKLLSDDAAVKRQRREMERLQERREQIEMMAEWRRSLDGLADAEVEEVAGYWREQVPGYHLNDRGLREARKLVRKFGLRGVLDAIALAADQTVVFDDEGFATQQSVDQAWRAVGGICAVEKMAQERPWVRDAYYFRGIARKRCGYFNNLMAKDLLFEAFDLGGSRDDLRDIAATCRNWTDWRSQMEGYIEGLRGNGET